MANESRSASGAGEVRVLVVEDSSTLRRLVTHLLRECGYEVTAACDGLEAVDTTTQAMADQRSYHVILMDVVMPELNGCEAAFRLRQQGYAGKILMLTAADEDYDLPRAFSAGADDYLAKPFTPGDLRRAVERNLADDDVNPLTRNPTAA